MTDLITLRGVSARSRHGVLPEEKLIPQPFLVDLDLEADLSGAGRSDRLADTVSYATMAAQVHRVLIGPSVDLLEHLAEKIALVCLQEPHVEAVTVTLHKPEAPVGVPCGDVEVRIRRERAARVVIAMGANLSASVERFGDAVRRLSRLPGVDLRMLSPIVVSEAVGGPDAQPPYLNAVLLAQSRLAAHTLLRALHRIEEIHGRTRDVRWGPRTLDLDLIRYADPILGEARGDGETLTLPHPRAHLRPFVLLPWLHVDPGARLPALGSGEMLTLDEEIGHRVADLVEGLTPEQRAGVRPGPDWPSSISDLVMVAP